MPLPLPPVLCLRARRQQPRPQPLLFPLELRGVECDLGLLPGDDRIHPPNPVCLSHLPVLISLVPQPSKVRIELIAPLRPFSPQRLLRRPVRDGLVLSAHGAIGARRPRTLLPPSCFSATHRVSDSGSGVGSALAVWSYAGGGSQITSRLGVQVVRAHWSKSLRGVYAGGGKLRSLMFVGAGWSSE